MFPRLVHFVLLSSIISLTVAYSGGAPEAVCEDMTPKHPAPPQTSRFPYTVSVDKQELRGPKDKLHITISDHKPFKGFLLQVRDGDKAIGQFEISDTDKFAKTITCFGNKGVSVSTPYDLRTVDFIASNCCKVIRLEHVLITTGCKNLAVVPTFFFNF